MTLLYIGISSIFLTYVIKFFTLLSDVQSGEQKIIKSNSINQANKKTCSAPCVDKSTIVRGRELHCVSKKTSPTFLAITRESIDGFL